jgi:hypothetical protein
MGKRMVSNHVAGNCGVMAITPSFKFHNSLAIWVISSTVRSGAISGLKARIFRVHVAASCSSFKAEIRPLISSPAVTDMILGVQEEILMVM